MIEIVLVLAITTLIVLIVIVAFGESEKSRRDAQRKRDFARIWAAFDQAANNKWHLPGRQQQWAGRLDRHNHMQFTQPDWDGVLQAGWQQDSAADVLVEQ